jgi:hypothetical protein
MLSLQQEEIFKKISEGKSVVITDKVNYKAIKFLNKFTNENL